MVKTDKRGQRLARIEKLRVVWKDKRDPKASMKAEDILVMYREESDYRGIPVDVVIAEDERAAFGKRA